MPKSYIQFNSTNMDCNETCCSWGEGELMCFSDYNFTEKCNLTFTGPWELGVRWAFTFVITTLGFFGNLCILLILFRNRLLLRTPVNRFIMNMALADFVLSCLGPVQFTISDTHQFYILGEAWCHLEGYIQILVMLVSTLSLTVISYDRMIGIVRPFHKPPKIWQYNVIIILIWILSAALAVPFMLYRVYTIRIWKDLTETNCGENNSKMGLWWTFTLIILIWIPMGVMLISYTSILVVLKNSKWRQRLTEHPAILRIKKRVIRMMFIVVVGFIVCWVPFQGNRIFYILNTENGRLKDPTTEHIYDIFTTVSQYLLYVNPAFNPIVYGLMHHTFKRAFRITFSCFFNKKSPFVLTRGQGRQRYVWSMKSTTSGACGHNMEDNLKSKNRPKICRRSLATPSPIVSSSAMVETIGTERYNDPKSSSSFSGIEREMEVRGASTSQYGTDYTVHQENEGKSGLTLRSHVNESYVHDLPASRTSFIASTGALGHLITQVIEEETSSDVDSERIL
ncbi:substance-K receptor-like isoform X2 [Palaemon carinicauda]|uniref:substance-K receptor-like isoform X2 n=1 Tax=Palaemon carinicauda TaxID=392227 RepID=UPI0035B5EA62